MKSMSVKQMLLKESDAAIDKAVKIPFEFKNVPEGKSVGDCIIIHPATVSTWFRLKPLLTMIEQKDYELLIASENTSFEDENIRDIMFKYDQVIFQIVCIGIHNKSDDMPDWFKRILLDSCDWADIYILLNAILFRIGTTSFTNSITALKAVSPLGEREIIALQENKEKWIRKAVSHSLSPSMKHSDIPISKR